MPLARIAVFSVLATVAAAACGASGPAAPPPSTAARPTTTTATTAQTAATAAPTTTTPPSSSTTTITTVATSDVLADQLTAAERAVRDPATSPDDVERQAHMQQLAYRTLGMHPEWDTDVLARVPPDLAPSVMRNIAARREFRSMVTKPADTLPAWRIVAPADEADLLAWYHEAEMQTGVGWQYLAAVNLVESGLGRIVGASTAGAQGPMQFMPSTWARYGEGGDIHDPHAAILAAARLLAHNGLPAGNIDGALFSYNNDNRYVRGVEDYAQVLAADPTAFHGYYHWQVYYLTSAGSVLLPEGYESATPVPVAEYLASHPQQPAG